MTRHLGRALSIIARQIACEHVLHADVDAFHAPSECHDLVARDEAKRCREARRHAKAVSGMSRGAFNRALRRAPRRAMERAHEIAFGRLCPWER